MESLSERLRGRESFRKTLEDLSTLYQSELYEKSPADKAIGRESIQRHVLGASPRKQTLPLLHESPALETVLHHLNVSSEIGTGPYDRQQEARTLYEKKVKMLDNLKSVNSSAESSLTSQLISVDFVSQLLSSSLNGDSSFEQEKKFAALEAQLGFVQKGIEGLDLDALYRQDKVQDNFVERWM